MSAPKVQATITADDDIEDPVDKMLKKTGCADLHYELQDCMAEKRDWRQCQDIVTKFKTCMSEHSRRQQAKPL